MKLQKPSIGLNFLYFMTKINMTYFVFNKFVEIFAMHV